MINIPPIFPEFVQTRKRLDHWVDENFREGKKLRWKTGPYKGRQCEIITSFVDYDYDLFTLLLRVATESDRTESGFLDDNDDFHRTYREYYENFEEIQPEKTSIHSSKTLEEQLATIETFGFGVDNYVIKSGQYVRKL